MFSDDVDVADELRMVSRFLFFKTYLFILRKSVHVYAHELAEREGERES